MVAHSSVSGVCPQPGTLVLCPARLMEPGQRQDLAVQALARTEPVRRLAVQHGVSRKFIYEQRARANEALQDRFCAEEADSTTPNT